ncbi:hypothetical protein FOA52_002277 [Chlamydomonas sp. UWO 241]|nr:hypothetical protein FOA52_002277 [Chlamydomonas sp. UWO 241]
MRLCGTIRNAVAPSSPEAAQPEEEPTERRWRLPQWPADATGMPWPWSKGRGNETDVPEGVDQRILELRRGRDEAESERAKAQRPVLLPPAPGVSARLRAAVSCNGAASTTNALAATNRPDRTHFHRTDRTNTSDLSATLSHSSDGSKDAAAGFGKARRPSRHDTVLTRSVGAAVRLQERSDAEIELAALRERLPPQWEAKLTLLSRLQRRLPEDWEDRLERLEQLQATLPPDWHARLDRLSRLEAVLPVDWEAKLQHIEARAGSGDGGAPAGCGGSARSAGGGSGGSASGWCGGGGAPGARAVTEGGGRAGSHWADATGGSSQAGLHWTDAAAGMAARCALGDSSTDYDLPLPHARYRSAGEAGDGKSPACAAAAARRALAEYSDSVDYGLELPHARYRSARGADDCGGEAHRQEGPPVSAAAVTAAAVAEQSSTSRDEWGQLSTIEEDGESRAGISYPATPTAAGNRDAAGGGGGGAGRHASRLWSGGSARSSASVSAAAFASSGAAGPSGCGGGEAGDGQWWMEEEPRAPLMPLPSTTRVQAQPCSGGQDLRRRASGDGVGSRSGGGCGCGGGCGGGVGGSVGGRKAMAGALPSIA